ncbi:MAG TPA: YjgN family protein [Casimicrobiaceae bacterium]|nr:YjgN family protein [Casimicrobiaceae bacterium]
MSGIDTDAADAAADADTAAAVARDPTRAEVQAAAIVDGDAPAAPGSADHLHPFQFTGRTSVYFRIWIVSLALSVLTLGIYSAWGKVRKKRYLFDHTRVDGSGFEFRGSPAAILRGRIIALVLFGGIALGGHVMIELRLALIAVLILLTPWIAVASARFNARNTFYRNVGFDFDGTLRESIKVFLGFGAIALVTLGLAYPWFRARRARFIAGRHRFGATPFTSDVETGDFVLMYLFSGLALVACVGLFFGAMVIAAVMGGRAEPDAGPPLPAFYAVIVLLYGSYLVIFAFMRARTQNLIANGTVIGPLRLRSKLRTPWLAWLYLTNVLAVIGSIGLATPWAVVRLARYRARTLVLVAAAPLGTLMSAPRGSASATAAEVSDLFDVDVAL